MDEIIEKPYKVGNEIKKLVNNENLSDITFIVGSEQKLFYCHKNILSLGSPVFKSMFYGGLKEKEDVIVIPDLEPSGFKNIIKYIYGHKVEEIDLKELRSTYIAADKYLVHHLKDSLMEYVNKILSEKNCFIIYENLNQLPSEQKTMNRVINLIRMNTKQAVEDDHFLNIDEDTLIDLLQSESLNIDEIEILSAITKWVDAEIERKQLLPSTINKQFIFKNIKNLVRFSKLNMNEIVEFDKIDDLLNLNEIGNLFLHIKNKNYPFTITCETNRKKMFTILNECNQQAQTMPYFQIRVLMNVNKEVSLKRIRTSLNEEVTRLNVRILENDVQLALDEQLILEENKWVVEFGSPVELDPLNNYLLIFNFDSFLFNKPDRKLSNINEFKIEDRNENYAFTLNFDQFHCIRGIDFYS